MSRVTDDDVLFGFRLQLFDYAARTSVSEACRVFGVHRSTFYVWKRRAERHGLGILRPRERRSPRMPNQLSVLTEQRIVAFALGHPGFGPQRIAAELGREKWGGLEISKNGVWRTLRRHGLNTRARRLALVAGYASPPALERAAEPERHLAVERPGELVGIDCFFVGRLRGTRHPVWQLTAIDLCSSYAWANLVTCPAAQPSAEQTSALARRVASDLHRAGWRLERVLCDNGNEFRSHRFADQLAQLGAVRTHIRAGRPQTNGHVENLHKTILDECWRPAFARSLYPAYTALRRDLVEYLDYYNTDRVHSGRLTRGRIPIDIIDPARKMRHRP